MNLILISMISIIHIIHTLLLLRLVAGERVGHGPEQAQRVDQPGLG